MPKPSPQQITNALPHVRWEMVKLVQALDAFRSADAKKASREKIEKAIYLEAFLLHARNLNVFFSLQRSGHEMWCGDFRYTRSARDELIADRYRKLLNSQLAHLSYKRENLSPQWPLDIFRELFLQCVAFAEHVIATKSIAIADDERKHWVDLPRRIKESTPVAPGAEG